MKKFPQVYHSVTGKRSKRPAHSFWQSVHFAVQGITKAWQREPNLQLQLVLYGLVLMLAWLLKLSVLKIALLIIVATSVVILELLNSALESLADALHPQHHDKIRDAKDMAAGAVLVMSFAAAIIGILLLAEPFFRVLAGIEQPL
ncbi:MAG: diacylglycerol kinase [Candidatus Andersenbacteria bacterium]